MATQVRCDSEVLILLEVWGKKKSKHFLTGQRGHQHVLVVHGHFGLTRAQSFTRNNLGAVSCPSRVRPGFEGGPRGRVPTELIPRLVPRVNIASRVGRMPVPGPYVRVNVALYRPAGK